MTEQIWIALIGAAALLGAGYLGYTLRGRAKRSAERREALQAQLDRVYSPIYDLLKHSVPPDEPLDEIDPKAVDRIVEVAAAHRKLLERQLESIIDSIQESLWRGPGSAEVRDLAALWQHVERRYNQLKKALGLPHKPHWAKLPLTELYKEIRSWWWGYTWERERKRKERERKRKIVSKR